MRVIVAGPRDWEDPLPVRTVLHGLYDTFDPLTLVHGACPIGVDELVSEWFESALRAEIWLTAELELHPADWKAHGKKAGPIRNKHMASLGAHLCVVFKHRGDDWTNGTLNMRNEATKQGIPVWIVEA